jgi:ribulose-5-phosphate 4-epimerase/fuculose-1-phosphate aldolase
MYDDLKDQVASATRVLAEMGLATGVTATLGHVSLRIPGEPDKFLVKGRGYQMDALATMRGEDMVLCDLEGYMLEGPPGTMPCMEVKIHSCIFKARPDVESIVHVHPRYSVLTTLLQLNLRPMCIEGTIGKGFMKDNNIPVYEHMANVNTDAEGTELAEVLGNATVCMLEGHGAVSVGTSVQSSVITMMQLEEQARMNYLAYCAMGREYRSIPESSLVEDSAKGPLNELPHFVEVMKHVDRSGIAVWPYYEKLAALTD